MDPEPARERPAPQPRRVAEVLRYFLRNPRAADSLEGVVRWRLSEETIHRSVTEIDEALHWLVEHQLLLAQSAPGVAPVFSLNSRKIQEAQDLVADDGPERR
jgi:hypothetical protein